MTLGLWGEMLYIASFHPVTRRNIPTWFCRIGTRKKNLVQHKHLVVIGPISNNLANCKKKDCLLYSQHQELRRRFWQKNGGNTLQRTNTENSYKYSQKRNCAATVPIFKNHVSVSDLYIPMIDLPNVLRETRGPIMGLYKSLIDT